MGKCRPCPSLKSLSSTIGGMLCHCGSPNKYKKLDSKLERKMIEMKRSASGQSNFKSIDSIIVRFPQFRDGLKNLRGVFEQYDEDSNGTIDREELNKCLEKLQFHLTKEETLKIDSPQLEATFDTIVEAFLFLDKNGDGKLNKKDMIKALNEASPWERSPAHVTRTRFKEMDWDKNGKVSFREFLFAFINWVGIESDEELPD
ncbi:PREDICTED: probable calcium-binding protein CML22 isoform X3 [Theobroma cacao]|uniref:Probable calcium-binding protein CML22 isoform X3 n=1 Tax=Theobroma cacao TaxID=3641 RepID=A0AB32W7W8_THECC|nr:PREDICTED: probable calcium-binding protein CML22 isoform X3 [Theobroma cacao]